MSTSVSLLRYKNVNIKTCRLCGKLAAGAGMNICRVRLAKRLGIIRLNLQALRPQERTHVHEDCLPHRPVREPSSRLVVDGRLQSHRLRLGKKN